MRRGVKVAVAAAVTVVVIGASAGGWRYAHRQGPCSFPKEIAQQKMPLYCMDERRLPKEIQSNTLQASTAENVVLYSLQDGNATLNVSIQPKPADDVVSNFMVKVIPLHFDINTPVGKAQTGVAEKKSITSLVADKKSWILITGPENYSPDRLTTLLKLFTRD